MASSTDSASTVLVNSVTSYATTVNIISAPSESNVSLLNDFHNPTTSTSLSHDRCVTPGDERRRATALRGADGTQIATLLLPTPLDDHTQQRLDAHVVPALQALVAIAQRRDQLQAEAVETAALRRSDDVKTALLRTVSHDLRTPLTAIVAAGHALGTGSLTQQERSELSAAVVEEGARLATLVDKLLDLSKLQAG